jgi:hypothetical protein
MYISNEDQGFARSPFAKTVPKISKRTRQLFFPRKTPKVILTLMDTDMGVLAGFGHVIMDPWTN